MHTVNAVLVVVVAALPTIAQIKTLQVINRVPVSTARNYVGGIAYPTSCDETGRLYVKLIEPGPGMTGPVFRLSSQGVVEAQFDTTGMLTNRFAALPDGGVVMVREEGSSKFVESFAPDGKRTTSVALEPTSIPFFPSQLAVFKSGEILVSGQQYRPGYKASTAIFEPGGRLIKQLALDGDVEVEDRIAGDTDAQRRNISAMSTSVAIAGDDGLVYLMRATSPATVYAISAVGDIVRKIVVAAPVAGATPDFGLRVAKNRLVVQFRETCDEKSSSCKRTLYPVVDATTGKPLATYEADAEAAGPIACFASNPDQFHVFFQNARGLEILEADPK